MDGRALAHLVLEHCRLPAVQSNPLQLHISGCRRLPHLLCEPSLVLLVSHFIPLTLANKLFGFRVWVKTVKLRGEGLKLCELVLNLEVAKCLTDSIDTSSCTRVSFPGLTPNNTISASKW